MSSFQTVCLFHSVIHQESDTEVDARVTYYNSTQFVVYAVLTDQWGRVVRWASGGLGA